MLERVRRHTRDNLQSLLPTARFEWQSPVAFAIDDTPCCFVSPWSYGRMCVCLCHGGCEATRLIPSALRHGKYGGGSYLEKGHKEEL